MAAARTLADKSPSALSATKRLMRDAGAIETADRHQISERSSSSYVAKVHRSLRRVCDAQKRFCLEIESAASRLVSRLARRNSVGYALRISSAARLTDHDGRGVCIGAGRRWHHRCIPRPAARQCRGRRVRDPRQPPDPEPMRARSGRVPGDPDVIAEVRHPLIGRSRQLSAGPPPSDNGSQGGGLEEALHHAQAADERGGVVGVAERLMNHSSVSLRLSSRVTRPAALGLRS